MTGANRPIDSRSNRLRRVHPQQQPTYYDYDNSGEYDTHARRAYYQSDERGFEERDAFRRYGRRGVDARSYRYDDSYERERELFFREEFENVSLLFANRSPASCAPSLRAQR